MAKDQYLDIILSTMEWHENKVKQLKNIVDNSEESKIKFQDDKGDQVELPEEHKKGFIMGITIALEVIGEFPVKISK